MEEWARRFERRIVEAYCNVTKILTRIDIAANPKI
jgi:hypothetical protein